MTELNKVTDSTRGGEENKPLPFHKIDLPVTKSREATMFKLTSSEKKFILTTYLSMSALIYSIFSKFYEKLTLSGFESDSFIAAFLVGALVLLVPAVLGLAGVFAIRLFVNTTYFIFSKAIDIYFDLKNKNKPKTKQTKNTQQKYEGNIICIEVYRTRSRTN
ncbi:hypothetical protein QTV49_000474 [Vibrio vulnificus]|nr:hypothetical protein [Vibrio vulnificus]